MSILFVMIFCLVLHVIARNSWIKGLDNNFEPIWVPSYHLLSPWDGFCEISIRTMEAQPTFLGWRRQQKCRYFFCVGQSNRACHIGRPSSQKTTKNKRPNDHITHMNSSCKQPWANLYYQSLGLKGTLKDEPWLLEY